MAYEQELKDFSFKASADLSAKQFLFMLVSGVDTCTVTSAATDTVLGVLQNKPASGEAADVRCYGIAKVVAGGTVTAGDRVGTDNAGKAVTKTADADKIAGLALSTAASGELVSILLTPCAQRAA